MRREHGLLTPKQLADRQELRDRVQARQRIDAEQDAALREYRDGPPSADREPMVPLLAFILVALLCAALIAVVMVLS